VVAAGAASLTDSVRTVTTTVTAILVAERISTHSRAFEAKKFAGPTLSTDVIKRKSRLILEPGFLCAISVT
jgi:hypothetical protein